VVDVEIIRNQAMEKNIEIKKFIQKHNLASVVIGFLIGHSASMFVESIISGFIMGLIQPLLGKTNWKDHILEIGVFSFKWGEIFVTGLHFIVIIMMAVFIIKIIQYDEQVGEER
jgi:large-conductance mechanosensitive channel